MVSYNKVSKNLPDAKVDQHQIDTLILDDSLLLDLRYKPDLSQRHDTTGIWRHFASQNIRDFRVQNNGIFLYVIRLTESRAEYFNVKVFSNENYVITSALENVRRLLGHLAALASNQIANPRMYLWQGAFVPRVHGVMSTKLPKEVGGFLNNVAQIKVRKLEKMGIVLEVPSSVLAMMGKLSADATDTDIILALKGNGLETNINMILYPERDVGPEASPSERGRGRGRGGMTRGGRYGVSRKTTDMIKNLHKGIKDGRTKDTTSKDLTPDQDSYSQQIKMASEARKASEPKKAIREQKEVGSISDLPETENVDVSDITTFLLDNGFTKYSGKYNNGDMSIDCNASHLEMIKFVDSLKLKGRLNHKNHYYDTSGEEEVLWGPMIHEACGRLNSTFLRFVKLIDHVSGLPDVTGYSIEDDSIYFDSVFTVIQCGRRYISLGHEATRRPTVEALSTSVHKANATNTKKDIKAPI